MNQLCRVCGEPAAGFHFGAFTCEGCKSFFGRTCNNVSSLGECKNGGKCVINRKNRTACKACRLRKCVSVGMSKSGSRYGRRSNWFKIHCLLQEQTGSSSNMSVVETKRILEKLKASNSNPEFEPRQEGRGDDHADVHCASSPTVSSTEAQEANTSREESPIDPSPIQWFGPKVGALPSEAISLFTALSPFLLPPGLPLSQNVPHIQSLAQYFPILSLIATSAKLGLHPSGAFAPQDARENTAVEGEDAPLSLHAAEDFKRRQLTKIELSDAPHDDSRGNEVPLDLMVASTPGDRLHTGIIDPDREDKVSAPASPLSDLTDNRGRCDRTKLKAIFIERMKRSVSPPALEGPSRKRRPIDDLLFPCPEQDEPIDLSVKGFLPAGPNASSTPPPSVLACSMTVTPIDSCRTHVCPSSSPEKGSFSLREEGHSDPKPEQATSSSGVDLSCRG